MFLAVAVGADGFEKPVVIKRLLPKFAGRADIVSLLSAEAKLMTRLVHPNIVQVIDFGRGDKDDYFVVMELVNGTNFGQFCQAYAVKGERVPVPIALYITNQVLRGLAYAHANASADGKRLVHRDISPGNILLSTFGEVKVADFGVALVGGAADTRDDDDGWIVGKPAYMAPEQLERTAVDERADIYAVGAVLFQAITGTLHRGDISGTVNVPMQISAEARATLAEAATPELAEVVLRALAPEREGRYAHAREMARAIEQLVETGQKIATADELAEAVTAMVKSQSSQTKSVLLLSAEDDGAFGSGTELTRIGDGDDKHGFTLKIRDAPIALAPPTATIDDDDELLVRPRRRRWVVVGAGALALLALGVGLVSSGPRDGALREDRADPARAGRAAAASVPPAPRAASAAPPAPAGDRPVAELPSTDKPAAKTTAVASSGAPARKSDGHPRAKESATKENTGRETPAPGGQGSACRGQLHLYATHGWLLSGGPGSVQAPGRYDWPCGTYGLKAVSRLDSGDVRTVTVTIRAGAPGVVDLR